MVILPPARADQLRAASLTYSRVDATSFHSFTRSRDLRGRSFEGLVQDLMRWKVHERAGLRVAASSLAVTADAVVEMRLGVGPLALRIPCRVVYVVNEPDRCGFAYGTLPGHPVSGEESFVVSRHPGGRVEFTISAFSRPATRLSRAAGPLGRRLQGLMTERYLSALDR